MKLKPRPLWYMLLYTALIIAVILIMQPLTILHYQEKIDFLFPKGDIALQQRNLLIISQVLMLFVIIPVYILTFVFSWKYRAGGDKDHYDPDIIDNTLAEYVWWGFPLIITAIIGVITWVKTHELDPYKPIASDRKTLNVQVVALQWKWLFIYPEEKIAAVNFLQIPKDTPVRFIITADAPMNSLWIPDLGGQIYAMPKMQTELNLIANDTGDFQGVSANLSGEGFSGMRFVTRASTDEEYKNWVEEAQKSLKSLSWEEYEKVAAPSQDNPVEIFQLKEENLFNRVIEKYMHPAKEG